MAERDAGGLWKKGQSGNPNGRPKVNQEIRDLARQLTPEALEALRLNLKDENGSVRNTAAMYIIDRGWGKPAQAIVGDDEYDAVALRMIVTGVPRPSDNASGD